MPRFSSQQCSGAAANSGLPFQRQNRTCSNTMPPSTQKGSASGMLSSA